MYTLAILCFLSQKPITIIYSDDNKSKFLYNELTRDYFAKGIDNERVQCYLMQFDILKRTRFIDATKDPRYWRIRSFPVILYGEHYSEKIELPEKSFQESTWGLKSLYVTVKNMEADVSEWKRKCERISIERMRQSVEDVLNWLCSKYNSEYIDFVNEYYSEYHEEDDVYNTLKERFGDRDGFPKIRPLVLPPSPLMKYPWE